MDTDTLVGTWKLRSWQVIRNGQALDVFGAHPHGYLLLTREGRAMVLTTAEHRSAGQDVAAQGGLHASMLAYTGRFRVEGSEFITTVEVSWNEAWTGTEQRRRFRLDGDVLIVESAPAASLFFAGERDYRRIVWERAAV